MLRRQNPNRDPMSFLTGQSEMARRIRSHDWTGHPLGAPEQWSQVLRSALGICLNSAFPTAIYWGSDLRLLYNDAWSAIPGPRHPACLGEPAQEVWSDIWHIIEPQFRQIIETGEGISVEDQMLPLRRYGIEEETYWNYSFTPIRGDDGAIVGVFNSGSETTDKVVHARQTEFLLSVSDRLRDCASSDETMITACAALGEHLGLRRVGIRGPARNGGNKVYPVSVEWTAAGITPVGNTVPLEKLGAIAENLRAGRVARIGNTAMLANPEARRILTEIGAASVLAVPWTENRDLTAVLFLHAGQERSWSDDVVATAEKVLERMINAVDREQALARERVMAHEIDHRARNLLAVVRAVARLVDAPDVPRYRKKLFDRLKSLSSTHSLLSANRWSGVSLDALLEEELAPYRDGTSARITLAGPELVLSNEMAQALSMVFHELATNAAKHGGLSQDRGTLNIGWTLAEDTLDLTWTETREPTVPAPDPAGSTGFGSRLLGLVIREQLDGNFDQALSGTGFRLEMHLPMTPRRSQATASADSSVTQTGTRVLVVEDDPLVAMDLSDTLADFGYVPVGLSRTVEAALAAIDEHRPDLAVVDINLGAVSAAPVGDALAERGVPFLVMTGYEADLSHHDVFSDRPRVLKPFARQDLEARLDQLARAAGKPA